jgi:hypothetical protein
MAVFFHYFTKMSEIHPSYFWLYIAQIILNIGLASDFEELAFLVKENMIEFILIQNLKEFIAGVEFLF